jgi:hypothetical protein
MGKSLMEKPRYQAMFISNPEDFINEALGKLEMHKNQELVSLVPSMTNKEGKVIQYLMVLKIS